VLALARVSLVIVIGLLFIAFQLDLRGFNLNRNMPPVTPRLHRILCQITSLSLNQSTFPAVLLHLHNLISPHLPSPALQIVSIHLARTGSSQGLAAHGTQALFATGCHGLSEVSVHGRASRSS
jgi:hypothetical protein